MTVLWFVCPALPRAIAGTVVVKLVTPSNPFQISLNFVLVVAFVVVCVPEGFLGSVGSGEMIVMDLGFMIVYLGGG